MATGAIIQDGDRSVSHEERDRRFRRYLELVSMVTGAEGAEVFEALIDSMQARHDYGAYQRTLGRLQQFPARMFGQPFVEAHTRLITRQPTWAGDLFLSVLGGGPEYIRAFNTALTAAKPSVRDVQIAFIQQEEQEDGWVLLEWSSTSLDVLTLPAQEAPMFAWLAIQARLQGLAITPQA